LLFSIETSASIQGNVVIRIVVRCESYSDSFTKPIAKVLKLLFSIETSASFRGCVVDRSWQFWNYIFKIKCKSYPIFLAEVLAEVRCESYSDSFTKPIAKVLKLLFSIETSASIQGNVVIRIVVRCESYSDRFIKPIAKVL